MHRCSQPIASHCRKLPLYPTHPYPFRTRSLSPPSLMSPLPRREGCATSSSLQDHSLIPPPPTHTPLLLLLSGVLPAAHNRAIRVWWTPRARWNRLFVIGGTLLLDWHRPLELVQRDMEVRRVWCGHGVSSNTLALFCVLRFESLGSRGHS
jgi:hypothetical protein